MEKEKIEEKKDDKINYDKRIRIMQKKKDTEELSEVKKDLAREEEELKQFFNEQKASLKQDPTLTS